MSHLASQHAAEANSYFREPLAELPSFTSIVLDLSSLVY